MKKIGFIGYGLRSETMMKAFTGAGLPLAPAAVADPRLETLQPQLARDGRFADTRYYADAEEMLDREALDAVFIGTRCGLHARYAALVMERGLPLFLESGGAGNVQACQIFSADIYAICAQLQKH